MQRRVADVDAHGVMTPVDVTAAGLVLDGYERLRAAHASGMETVPVRVVAAVDERAYMVRAALTRKQAFVVRARVPP